MSVETVAQVISGLSKTFNDTINNDVKPATNTRENIRDV